MSNDSLKGIGPRIPGAASGSDPISEIESSSPELKPDQAGQLPEIKQEEFREKKLSEETVAQIRAQKKLSGMIKRSVYGVMPSEQQDSRADAVGKSTKFEEINPPDIRPKQVGSTPAPQIGDSSAASVTHKRPLPDQFKAKRALSRKIDGAIQRTKLQEALPQEQKVSKQDASMEDRGVFPKKADPDLPKVQVRSKIEVRDEYELLADPPEAPLDQMPGVRQAHIAEKGPGRKAKFKNVVIERMTTSRAKELTALNEPGEITAMDQHLLGCVEKYLDAAQKPFQKSGPDREKQFESLDKLLTEFKGDSAVKDHFRKDHKLLEDTLKDQALMQSPHISSPTHAMELKRLGMQPSVAGKVGKFTDVALEEEMTRLGGGAMSTVYSGKYVLPDGKSSFHGVFKPESTGWDSLAADYTGIDKDRPRGGYRNVATTRLEEVLGFKGLTTRSEMAIHDGLLGTVSERAKGKSLLGPEGLSYERVPAAAVEELKKTYGEGWIEKYNNDAMKKIGMQKDKRGEQYYYLGTTARSVNYDDPLLRRELVRLQLMDCIAGQVDRHAGNYFVELDTKSKTIGIQGIDNDISWGKDLTKFHDPERFGNVSSSIHLPQYLPPVVDREAHEAVMKTTPESLEKRMGGLLTTEEIKAAQSRLALVKAHLGDRSKCVVVDTLADWSKPEITQRLLAKQGDEYTNYIARDKEIQKDKALVGLLVDYDKH